MNNLITRTISALVVLVILIITYKLSGKMGLHSLGGLVLLIGLYEYWTLVIKNILPSRFLGLIYLLSGFFLLSLAQIDVLLIFFLPILLILITLTLWSQRNTLNLESLLQICLRWTFGLVYAILCPYLGLQLLHKQNGIYLFSALLILTFSSDMFAYVGGRIFGKTPLMSRLSPNKTVEGSLFGVLGSTLTFTLFAFYFPVSHYPLWVLAVASLFISFVGQTGDLFESLLKRIAGVKDSGKIMPGHGGVLDRLDALYFTAPLYWLLIHFTEFFPF